MNAARIAGWACLVALSAGTVRAQPTGSIGIGGQVGPDSGVSLRLIRPRATMTVLAAWNAAGYVRVETHVWTERAVPRSPLRIYAGPAVVAGSDHAKAILGAGFVTGTYFTRNHFEVYLQISPRLDIEPEVQLVLGSGVGLRYYL